jgi:YVTN family beta-propeller protein
VTTVDVGLGPQGIALTPDRATAYVPNFDNDTVSVIDTASNTVTATIVVAGSPNGVVASPDGNFVYVTAYNASNVRVIDTGSNTVVTSIGSGSFPIAVDYARIKP